MYIQNFFLDIFNIFSNLLLSFLYILSEFFKNYLTLQSLLRI